jgi:hypothetical protein
VPGVESWSFCSDIIPNGRDLLVSKSGEVMESIAMLQGVSDETDNS